MGLPGVSSRVTVEHLTKSYGRLTALSDVSFSIHAGEVLGLIGPNGAGKTTLFECMAGLLPHESGTVSVDGRPLAPRDRSSFLFYTPDAIAPWPAQTVSWALDFTLGFFGGPGWARAGDKCDNTCGEGGRAAQDRRTGSYFVGDSAHGRPVM